MSVRQFNEYKELKKITKLSNSLQVEYVLNKTTLKELGLSSYYPSQVIEMLLKASVLNIYRYNNISNDLTNFNSKLTTRSRGTKKTWYYDHQLIAQTDCDNQLVNKVSLVVL